MTTPKLEPLTAQEREELERRLKASTLSDFALGQFMVIALPAVPRLLAQLKAQEEAMRLALEACEAGEVAAAIVALRWSLPKEG